MVLVKDWQTRNGASPDNLIATHLQKQTQTLSLWVDLDHDYLFGLISQINWERKIWPNFFKYSPKVGINLGTGIFLVTIFLIPQYAKTLVLSRESFDREREPDTTVNRTTEKDDRN